MEWLNEPPHWRAEGDALEVTTGENTDFWRRTHYGFVRDDGHLWFQRAEADFTAEATIGGDYREVYDQAGLMLRLDAQHWVKAGVELVEGRRVLGCVVTREFSDWSTVPALDAPNPFRLRLSRHGATVRVEYAAADPSATFQLLRLAYLPELGPALVGPMCCSPNRAGFEARFDGFTIGPPISRDLH